ncbi:membrane protein [Malaciobacter pacificus]|jgi:hypothetical protein|uniref:PMT family membrane protein n=1 Tax=Malaciobacter pacificus TaxID=1080223 RepID=A0A5C2HFN9_9BACT|nr:glycosyltransferase family 39 protein [Malaciobacter pacificus]QEP35232.1 PMT family membrane protein [Malaciobacter pacificus]GGD42171.1 membrane protein [Malaciobacter pacificus]
MIKTSNYNYLFSTVLAFTVVVLLYTTQTLSISYKEALNVFVNNSVLSLITNTSIYIFGQNDLALRLPFIVFYTLSVILMFKLTKDYFKYERDRYISIFIFMILPGVISASLLVNSAIVITFCTLLYIYYYQKFKKHCYLLLFIYLFVDNSFVILYLAIFFFSLKNKDNRLIFLSLVLFLLSMSIYGLDTQGKPRGFLVDTFAIYASVFSPFLFIYFIYSMYRASLKNEERTFTWYISITALIVSLLFSFRQRVYIEDFAPYVVISLPFMLKRYFHSYRVRLSEFRKFHKISAIVIISMLLVNVFLTIVNKPLYTLLPDSKKHFAYKYHFVKELASELKKEKINYIFTDDEKLLMRLKFYNINSGADYFVSKRKFYNYDKEISIEYYGKKLYSVYIKKLK